MVLMAADSQVPPDATTISAIGVQQKDGYIPFVSQNTIL
jgi:hypothetical protein